MERNLNEDLKLSRFNLETAAEEQPSLQRHYGDQVAEKQKVRDTAKNRLRLRKGEVRIELKAQRVDGKSPTREDLDAMVDSHPEIDRLCNDLSDAEYELELAYSAKAAVESKKSMIETEQRLYGANYFSTPNSGTGNTGRENLPGYRPAAT